MADKLKAFDPTNPRHLEHAEHQDGSIARKGSVPKHSNDGPVPHSWGNTPMQRAGENTGGLSHATATINDGGETIASSAAASPLSDAYSEKPDLKSNSPAAPPSWGKLGMRSRINSDTETLPQKVQAGKDCLDQAVKSGATELKLRGRAS
jgi:hypothetical protein